MKGRLLAGGLAVVLAAVGTMVLLAYVRGADARAASGPQTVAVMVVATPIASGTPATELADHVTTTELPMTAVLPNHISDLSQLAG